MRDNTLRTAPFFPRLAAWLLDRLIIITRNPDHFHASAIPVYSPSEFAAKLNEPQK